MDTSLEHLKRLLEKLKQISFWDRCFRWGKVRNMLVDANGDLQRIAPVVDSVRAAGEKAENQLQVEKNETKNLRESLQQVRLDNIGLRESQARFAQEKEEFQKRIASLEEKNEGYFRRGTELKHHVEILETQIQQLRTENTRYKADEDQRRKEHEHSVASLNKLTEGQRKREEDEINQRHRKEIERVERLRETWSRHEENVKARIKAICNRHGVDYLEKVPFKGSPDNTLRIKDEYVVFDAKSPWGDDLSNFPGYLKNQVEQAIKYVREEDVRKEVFLVVPTNTLQELEQFEFKLADYTVYVISLDSLEPIIIALKKIEDYEFADQLSPEERENICRVIGKFVHLSKRRIQIDGFFAKQFFELVYRSEADLPKDLLQKVSEFEKSEKLNPPIEKRSKQINTKELEADANRLSSEANQKGIITQDTMLSREFNKLPLYSTETEEAKGKDQTSLFGEKDS
ncbi:MAG: hypothetical protein SH819_13910 [Cytophagales bacterium]|nr:hypothetical protein [Cytophagales bacterium]